MLRVVTEWNQPCRGLAGAATLHLGVRIRPELPPGVVPIHVLVLLDVSSSMDGPKFENALSAVRAVWSRLQPGDRLAVLTFATKATEVLPWALKGQTQDNGVEGALSRCRPGGTTRLDLGMGEALRLLAGCPPGQLRFLWLVTDGDPTDAAGKVVKDRSSYLSGAGSAAAQGLVMGALGLGDPEHYRAEFLCALADRGGGSFLIAPNPASLSSRLEELLRSARAVTATRGRLELSLQRGTSLTGYARVLPELVMMDQPQGDERWTLPIGALSMPETVLMLEVVNAAPFGLSPGVHPLGELSVVAEVQGRELRSPPVPIRLEYAPSASRKISSRNREMDNLRRVWEMAVIAGKRMQSADPAEQLRMTDDLIDLSRQTGNLGLGQRLEAERQQLAQQQPLSRGQSAEAVVDVRASGRLIMTGALPKEDGHGR